MNRVFLLITLMAFSLSACAVAAKVRARNEMEESKAAYKECLRKHPDDISACEAFGKMYEADLKAFRATSGALKENGGTVVIEK